jgi:hypothetical protein
MAQRLRDARLRDEAYNRAWEEKWAEERARPFGERAYLRWDEIAEQLASDPHSLASDPALAHRVVADLAQWVERRQFGSEVCILSGEPPDFQPVEIAPGDVLIPRSDMLFLTRSGVRRYVEARLDLPGAAGLLREFDGNARLTAPQMAAAAHPAEQPSGVRTNKAEAAEAMCRRWLVEWGERWRRGLAEQPENKDTAFSRAKKATQQIGHLSEEAFKRAWAMGAPTEWKKAGRRKKAK